MPSNDVDFVYDDSGRLVAVVDPVGDSAIYEYDGVGNLLSISHQSSSTLGIIEFRPKSGAATATVTIQGTGFSATASENVVTFNGVRASVVSANLREIVASVPQGAVTGLIAVSTPRGSSTSRAEFVVTSASEEPEITGFTPNIGAPGTPVMVTGSNFAPVAANNKLRFNRTRTL